MARARNAATVLPPVTHTCSKQVSGWGAPTCGRCGPRRFDVIRRSWAGWPVLERVYASAELDGDWLKLSGRKARLIEPLRTEIASFIRAPRAYGG